MGGKPLYKSLRRIKNHFNIFFLHCYTTILPTFSASTVISTTPTTGTTTTTTTTTKTTSTTTTTKTTNKPGISLFQVSNGPRKYWDKCFSSVFNFSIQICAHHLFTKRQMAIAVVHFSCQTRIAGIMEILSAKQLVPGFQK